MVALVLKMIEWCLSYAALKFVDEICFGAIHAVQVDLMKMVCRLCMYIVYVSWWCAQLQFLGKFFIESILEDEDACCS